MELSSRPGQSPRASGIDAEEVLYRIVFQENSRWTKRDGLTDSAITKAPHSAPVDHTSWHTICGLRCMGIPMVGLILKALRLVELLTRLSVVNLCGTTGTGVKLCGKGTRETRLDGACAY